MLALALAELNSTPRTEIARTEFDVESSPQIQVQISQVQVWNLGLRSRSGICISGPGLSLRQIQSSGPGLDLTSNPVLRSRAEPSPISAKNPDPGLRSILDLQIQV